MKIILDKLRPLGFNERPLTEADFYRICEQERIEIIWSEQKFSFYFSALGASCIVLPKRLRGLRLLFAAFHELGHHFTHLGCEPAVMWLGMSHDKDEFEADALALVALMPKHSLKDQAFLDGSRYGARLYNERLRLWFLYGV